MKEDDNRKNNPGRPKAVIDFRQFEELAKIQCTQTEISAVLGITRETLRLRVEEEYGECYADVYKRYQEAGFASLRRFQFAQAERNATMAIWLGKQYLGQKDTVPETIIPPETINQFNALMAQLGKLQVSSKDKIETINAKAA